MKGSSFIRGAAVGGIGAALVMTATSALAGTGVGGVFNLGQANSVDQRTLLTGNTPSGNNQLQVTDTLAAGGSALGAQSSSASPTAKFVNNSTGSAASFTVQPGKAPFTTNSTVKVKNLNADTVDGLDSTAFLPASGKAADADKLDGLDSSAFAQGHATMSAAAFSVNAGSTQVISTGSGPNPDIGLQVAVACPASPTTQNLGVGFINSTGTAQNTFIESSSAFDGYLLLPNGSSSASIPTNHAGETYTVQMFGQPNFVSTNTLVHMAVVGRASDCHFQYETITISQ